MTKIDEIPRALIFTMDWGDNAYDDEGNEIPGTHTSYFVCHPEWDEEEEYWKPNIQQSIEEFSTEEEAKASIAKMEVDHV